MKKVLAILIAVMLLLTAAASAESVFSFADPVLTLNTGETQTIDLTGLEVVIASEEMNGGMAIQVDVNGDGNKLLGISANVVGEKVVFAIDGVSNVYSAEIPVGAVSGVASLDLSALNIDVEALMTTVMSSIEMDGNTIKIPYTAVNEILEALAPALEGMEIPGVDMSQLADTVAQLKQSNSGISLEVTYAEAEGGMSFSAAAIPVQDGTAGDVALNISFEMGDSGMNARIEAPGQGAFYFNMQPVDDVKVKVNLGGEAQGMGFDLSGIASSTEADVEFAALDAGNAIDVQSMTEEQTEAFSSELMGAAMGLIGYVYGALGAAA